MDSFQGVLDLDAKKEGFGLSADRLVHLCSLQGCHDFYHNSVRKPVPFK